MVSQNLLTIDISNVDFNSTKFRMVGDLTLDKVKIKYNWIFNAQIKDAIIGEDQNGLVWYSGTWISGTWEQGTWYSGVFLDGRWKGGDVYSYDIDIKQLLNGIFYIIRTDISKTQFFRCSFEGGNFNYGIFGDIKIKDNKQIQYDIDREFIINNIETNVIDSGFNTEYGVGFYLPEYEMIIGNNYFGEYTETDYVEDNNTIENKIFDVVSVLKDKENRILLGGVFSKYNNINVSGLLRLNYDGTIENTFNGGLFIKQNNNFRNGDVSKIAKDNNDRIIITGDFNYYNGVDCYKIIRIFDDGTFDNDFKVILNKYDDIEDDYINIINDIYIDSKNMIYMGGNFKLSTTINGTIYTYKNLVKLNENGSIDTEFSFKDTDNGIELNGFVNVLKYVNINDSNKLLVGGSFVLNYIDKNLIPYIYDKLLRIDLDGRVDTTYLSQCSDVLFSGSVVYTVDVDSMNRIYVGGDFLSYSYKYTTYNNQEQVEIIKTSSYSGIVRLNENGTISDDGEFTGVGGFSNGDNDFYIKSIRVDLNDNIIVGGYFNKYNSDTSYNIIKILKSDDVDKNFNVGYGTYNAGKTIYDGSVSAVFIDNFNKIYLGGKINKYNEVDCGLILRLNTDGLLDNINNKTFLNNNNNKSIFKNGNFYNGLFTSSIFKSGNFYNGYFNNSIWYKGVWYDGEFLSGEWHDGQFLGGLFSNGNWYGGNFSELKSTTKSYFGLNFLNKKTNAANWYGGNFSNGNFYSLYHKKLNETEKLNHSTDVLDITDNTIVNWYNGTFNNGLFYGGTIHNCVWDNGIIYDSIILNIKFNNGHIYDTICQNGIFNGGSISGGIYENIIAENVQFGYDMDEI